MYYKKGIIHKKENSMIIDRVNKLLEDRGQLGLVTDPKSEEGIVAESAFMIASDEHESRIAKIFSNGTLMAAIALIFNYVIMPALNLGDYKFSAAVLIMFLFLLLIIFVVIYFNSLDKISRDVYLAVIEERKNKSSNR